MVTTNLLFLVSWLSCAQFYWLLAIGQDLGSDLPHTSDRFLSSLVCLVPSALFIWLTFVLITLSVCLSDSTCPDTLLKSPLWTAIEILKGCIKSHFEFINTTFPSFWYLPCQHLSSHCLPNLLWNLTKTEYIRTISHYKLYLLRK